jgi:hypothetical protein
VLLKQNKTKPCSVRQLKGKNKSQTGRKARMYTAYPWNKDLDPRKQVYPWQEAFLADCLGSKTAPFQH